MAAREGSSGNRVIDTLAGVDQDWLLQHMSHQDLTPPRTLQEPGHPIEKIYFPTDGVISLTTPLGNGSEVEAAVIGNEGMFGLQALAADGTSPSHLKAVAQIPGGGFEIRAEPFRKLVAEAPALQTAMATYAQALITQIAQGAACNAAHPILQRCARWLLESHDRVRGDEFLLTQEFLSEMLGVTRPSVTVAAGTLQAAGMISYQRGRMKILDREALESASCECYAAISQEYERLMGPPRVKEASPRKAT
jgi:CRP-like cAMP-binding protein